MTLAPKHFVAGAVVIAIAGALFLLVRPQPVVVETVPVTRAALQVTVDEEGETRVRDRYVVAAPVAGRVARIALREGDPVAPGTVVARIYPAPLDARAREEAAARIQAAEDAQRAADAGVARARAASEQAQRARARSQQLAAQNLIPPEERERAELEATTRGRELEAAQFQAQAAAHDVEIARAALLVGAGNALVLRAPVAGRVLRIAERSERVVAGGTPLVEVGDPLKIEIVADLLSADAVSVAPGDVMLIEAWGGDSALRARLRTVEPSGFTKVSALGVEEQRVNVVGDFVHPPPVSLGDRYRVDVRVVVWQGERVLQLPASALVRRGAGWSVFAVERGRARQRDVQIGHRTAFAVEVTAGLREGDVVIRNPSDRIAEGVRVAPQ